MEFEEFIEKFPEMVDLSCVRAAHTVQEIEEMIELAAEYHAAAVFAMPSYTSYVLNYIADHGLNIKVGGVVGFPSGASTTELKRLEAEMLVKMGCDELDMVINQSDLVNLHNKDISHEIQAIVNEAGEIPVKVILEVNNLSDEEIERGCRIAAMAGASFVKTGTGWHEKPTEVRHIELMKASVGSLCKIKAAGGIRSMETAYEMYQQGCERFGLSVSSFKKIMNL